MFKVEKFDSNVVADDACKELFKKTARNNKNKTRKGKVTKNIKNNTVKIFKHEDKIKDEIKAIVNDRLKTGKIKIKKKNKLKREESNNISAKHISVLNKNTESKQNKKKECEIQENNIIKESKSKKRRKRKKKLLQEPKQDIASLNYKQKKHQKVKEMLEKKLNLTPDAVPVKKQKTREKTLRERMMEKLQAARFRYLNEQIYSSDGKEAQKIFKEDPDAFKAYHEGYRQQVSKWPLNPLDVIIQSVQKMPKTHVIADFGCGDAKLAQSVKQKVHSFDLVAVNDSITACDMAHVPLENSSVDVVVFCLSLMGTNLHDYLLEANRVLVPGGILKIAEVESRFDDVNQFIEAVKKFNFKNTWKDLSHNLFYFMDFKKEANIKKKKKLPTLNLNPCLYKKR